MLIAMHVFFGVDKLGFFLLLRIPSLPLFSTYTKINVG